MTPAQVSGKQCDLQIDPSVGIQSLAIFQIDTCSLYASCTRVLKGMQSTPSFNIPIIQILAISIVISAEI